MYRKISLVIITGILLSLLGCSGGGAALRIKEKIVTEKQNVYFDQLKTKTQITYFAKTPITVQTSSSINYDECINEVVDNMKTVFNENKIEMLDLVMSDLSPYEGNVFVKIWVNEIYMQDMKPEQWSLALTLNVWFSQIKDGEYYPIQYMAKELGVARGATFIASKTAGLEDLQKEWPKEKIQQMLAPLKADIKVRSEKFFKEILAAEAKK